MVTNDSKNNPLQRFCSTRWGASANKLRTTVPSLVCSEAEYWAPVWWNITHTSKVETQPNIPMRAISHYIETTSSYCLPKFRDIPPLALWREVPQKKYTKTTNNLQLPIHEYIWDLAINRLRSTNPPIVLAQQLTASNFNVTTSNLFWY